MAASTDLDGTHGVAGAVGLIMASAGPKIASKANEVRIFFMMKDMYSPRTDC